MMFYVGKTTKKIYQRFAEHMSDSRTRKGRTQVSVYISELPVPPRIQVIDTILCNNHNEKHCAVLENFWINGLREMGLPLVNVIS